MRAGGPMDKARSLYLAGTGPATTDLAASSDNTVRDRCFTHTDDALTHPWAEVVQPPGVHLPVLVPGSAGAHWWRDCTHDQARVVLLNGRITVDGRTGPCAGHGAFLVYSPVVRPGCETWPWKQKDE
jgi:hypothetical protein